ncbi:hypothetical protein E2562_006874 [Oryza meyeriana var. granulata]|uniref:Uncharacterized protein n=1 Tax=Oryza meyeriana var. granulata TaxID=110450 RepID=A0A6G1C6J3_9ORYZ|nr:hypothetical protein E2562_006874 [Oryza meyeriana var. granulata]
MPRQQHRARTIFGSVGSSLSRKDVDHARERHRSVHRREGVTAGAGMATGVGLEVAARARVAAGAGGREPSSVGHTL